MISLTRLKIDLFIQLALAVSALLVSLFSDWQAPIVLVGILASWQMISTLQLRIIFRLQTRNHLLLMGVLATVFGLLLVYKFGWLAWLPLATVAAAHLLHHIEEISIVRRRVRTFWDL